MNHRACTTLLCLLVGVLGTRLSTPAAAEEPRAAPQGRPPTSQGHPPPTSQGFPPTGPAARATTRPNTPPGPPAGRPSYDGRGQVLDSRYNHGRYYPPPGTVARSLPPDHRPYYHGGHPYYFQGGVWYAPRGGSFVVVAPPAGIVVSVLPPYYSTVWFGGLPYYYADNAYYSWQPDQNGYAVVDPPDDADPYSAAAPPASDATPPDPIAPPDLIIYPKNGQSKDQQAADEYECHNWARSQSGFDPAETNGGLAPGDADRGHSNYDRAMSACLQGRNYQVN
jgi:hypothetical protein